MNVIRIASAITSMTGITLYTTDGKEVNLPSTSWRTRQIMDAVVKPLARHQSVEIDLDAYSMEGRFEAKTGGFVRFLRDTWSSFTGLFATDEVTEDGPSPRPNEETLVAIVNGVKIPGLEKLEQQIENAVTTGNTKGLERFLDRLSKVSDKRSHTVQELLRFLERGDLPIADDGCIIAYKVLASAGESGVFVDCHSRSVTQRVGSRVSMAEELVNPSRRLECSSGLHVARRGYLRNFPGDVITLIKVAPEDVIAVPFNEPNKMRVAAYHLVALLPKQVYATLRANKPMTDDAEAAKILANVIAGDHVGVIEEVRIGAALGGNLVVTPVGEFVAELIEADNGLAKAIGDTNRPDPAPVLVEEVRKAVEEAVAEQAAVELEPVVAAPEKKAKSQKNAKATPKAKQKASADPVPAAKAMKPQYIEALKMHRDGKSAREIEKALHICRKTVARLIADNPV